MYCTFIDYVADIYNNLMSAPRADLKALDLENELKQEVPPSLYSMLEKESKEDDGDGHLPTNMHRYYAVKIKVHKNN